MEVFFSDTVKAGMLGVIAVAFVLNGLARRNPHVAWLQAFRLPTVPLTQEQKEKRRRHANRMAAVEIILAGLILPLLYVASTVMMFNDFKPLATMLVAL